MSAFSAWASTGDAMKEFFLAPLGFLALCIAALLAFAALVVTVAWISTWPERRRLRGLAGGRPR